MRLGAAAALLLSLITTRAEAHIHLELPLSWTTENSLGDPQKDTPCGGEGGTPTGVINRFRPGETITVQWSETIYHPGHYRIAFAMSRADLRDPVVTVDANRNAVSATIDDPPVYPVLLDGLFPRTGGGGAGSVFTQDVTLPNVPCTNCVLQLIQFMEGHGPPNYIYYHCADIELVPDPPPDAGFFEDAEPVDVGFDDSGIPIDVGVEDRGVVDQGVLDTGIVDAGVRRDGTVTLPDARVSADVGEDLDGDNALHGSCACTSTETKSSSAWTLLLLVIYLRRR